jgi:hypothetical protein
MDTTLKQEIFTTMEQLPDSITLEEVIAKLRELQWQKQVQKWNETEAPPPSCLELALAHNLVGCIKDAPEDLSINKT